MIAAARSSLPTVLIPGVACSSRLWSEVIEPYNGVGNGDWDDATDLQTVSDFWVPQSEIEGNCTTADMASAILEAAPEEFNLAGLSMGGYVAMQILRQAPDRVQRLALMSTQARADSEEVKKRRLGLMTLAEKKGMKAVLNLQMPSLLSEQFRADYPNVVEEVYKMANEVGVEGEIASQNGSVVQTHSP